MKKFFSLFLFFFTLSLFLMFHTFSYDQNNHTFLISRKVWSDFGQHIPVIRSFSLGANWQRFFGKGPVEFPLYPGEPIHYHYLFYAVVGTFERLGVPIDWALNVPSALGLALMLTLLFRMTFVLFKDIRIAPLTILFFLFNGSLSFLQFFETHGFADIFTNSDFPSFAPWGPGPVSAFWNLNIYTNQRHLAWGFAIALGLMQFLSVRSVPLWIVIVGILPIFHQPTLLLIAIILASYFLLFPNLRKQILFIALGSAIILFPQLAHRSTAAQWYPGYLIHGNLTLASFLSYWWHNVGLHAVLIPIGFFLIPRQAKKTLLPLVFIFIIANLFKFSVEPAANHKLFNFALLLGNIISAYVTLALWKRIRWLTIILMLFLTLSGFIDFFAVYNDPKGTVADNETAAWIRDNTPSDAVFLNSSFFFHPASLAGRAIFLGWPYFAWSEGYKEDRLPIMKILYESHDTKVFCPLFETYGIDYVTIEDTQGDPNLPLIQKEYFSIFTPEFQQENFAIVSSEEMCARDNFYGR